MAQSRWTLGLLQVAQCAPGDGGLCSGLAHKHQRKGAGVAIGERLPHYYPRRFYLYASGQSVLRENVAAIVGKTTKLEVPR